MGALLPSIAAVVVVVVAVPDLAVEVWAALTDVTGK